MADQAMAESRALSPPAPAAGRGGNPLLRKASGAWRLSRRWLRFSLFGQGLSVPELVDFVLWNRFFTAIQKREELTKLAAILAARRPGRALEIGTAHGGTLLLLTRLASPRATIVSVDLPGGRFGGGYSDRRAWFYQRFARRRQRLHLIRADSHSDETFARVRSAFGGAEIDYLFIDGDHRYEGVKRDFELYAPLVKRGGLIAFHDIVEGPEEFVGGVPRFWREIRGPQHHQEFVLDPKQGGFGIGVLYLD